MNAVVQTALLVIGLPVAAVVIFMVIDRVLKALGVASEHYLVVPPRDDNER